MITNEKTVTRLDLLTFARFFAAMGVVVFHTGHAALSGVSANIDTLFSYGYIWVGFFYVLSGFVLSYAFSSSRLSRSDFYTARIARIYPAYALALLMMIPPFVLRIHQGEYPATRLVASLVTVPTMMQAWIPMTVTAWNYPAWSVSAEFFFYLVFPFALVRIKQLIEPSSTIKTSLISPLAALWLVSLLPSLLCLYFVPGSMAQAGELTSPWRNFVFCCPLLRLPEFLAGIFLGCSFIKQRKAGMIPLSSSIPLVVLAIAALTFVLTAHRGVIPVPLLHNGLLLPLWAMLIYGLAAIDTKVGRALVPPSLVLLGEASYGTYILQTPISNGFKFLIQLTTGSHVKGDYPSLQLLFAYCLLLTVCSILSFKFFETPVRLYIRKIAIRRSAPAVSNQRMAEVVKG